MLLIILYQFQLFYPDSEVLNEEGLWSTPSIMVNVEKLLSREEGAMWALHTGESGEGPQGRLWPPSFTSSSESLSSQPHPLL